MKEMLKGKKRIHFVGIGGIGMSAIAKILAESGYRVSGSDLEMNNLTEKLRALGVAVFQGHKESHVGRGVKAVVYSSSIDRARNPEILKAKKMGIPIVQRACVLGELLNSKKGIAVTGTHGKTTTTSLISVMLAKAAYDPTVAIGGEVELFGSNARRGKGGWMVAEADESDGSFMYLKPLYSVVTNIEMEHTDHYKSMGEVIDGYAAFVNNTRKEGVLFYNNDDEHIKKVLARFGGVRKSYGLSRGATVYATDITMREFETSYTCIYEDRRLGTVLLRIPGLHNVSNSLAAILVGMHMGIGFRTIRSALAGFTGAKRRFQLKFRANGVLLIDDYAHHPTEIRAVIEATRAWRGGRRIAVFQPHRFTRTKYFKKEFGRCFRGVDKLVLTDIYAASERPLKGVTIEGLCREAKRAGVKDARVMKKEDLAHYVLSEARSGDIVLVMGAGDIKKVSDELAERFTMRSAFAHIRGRVLFGEPLKKHTTFRIGGPADVWIEPRDVRALKEVLRICASNGWKVFVVGNGSNVLARDEGWRGVVVCLNAPSFTQLAIRGTCVTVGAGYSLSALIRRTCRAGLGGLESMVGIPGTMGGALFMNAGGAANPMYGNIGMFVTAVKVIDYSGKVRTLSGGEVTFQYRASNLSPFIVIGATLKLSRQDKDILLSRLCDFLRLKRSKQVLDIPSAGCIFKNPADFQFTAGQLIDMMGFKGTRVGGAEVSRKHANFIVNAGSATSRDVLTLVESIRRKAEEVYDIPLELEVKVI